MNISKQALFNLPTDQPTTEEALLWFDSLDIVTLDFMIGRWQGSEIQTNHPLNGLLMMSGWYGKEFVDRENVHPLLFCDRHNQVFKVAPHPTVMNWSLKLLPILKNKYLQPLIITSTSFLKTEASQARLRMMEHRGQVTATMIYDYLPINDSFRKIDENTVLGIMDYKLLSQPFFFLLKRC